MDLVWFLLIGGLAGFLAAQREKTGLAAVGGLVLGVSGALAGGYVLGALGAPVGGLLFAFAGVAIGVWGVPALRAWQRRSKP